MSVDITRLTEHLPPQQREAVRKAYQARAENETAAFLWCFFLGVLGVHHFYLRQWGKGLLHLWPPLATTLVVGGGVVLDLSPVLIVAAAVPLVFFAVIWMFVDLFRIDAEVAGRNLQLAEQLAAAALLADPVR